MLPLEVAKTLRQQTGASEQRQRTRDLPNHQKSLRTRRGNRRASTGAPQSIGRIGMVLHPGGRHAENQPCNQR